MTVIVTRVVRTDLSVTVDLVSDPTWTVYSVTGSGSGHVCDHVSGGGNTGTCHRVERAGVVFFNDVVRDVRTASDLEDCSELCHQAAYCRSFTFKYETSYVLHHL